MGFGTHQGGGSTETHVSTGESVTAQPLTESRQLTHFCTGVRS